MAAALKDSVDGTVVAELSERFVDVDPTFDAEGFVAATSGLAELELKGRIELIARGIWRSLADHDGAERISCVVEVAKADPPVDGWATWPLAAVIELFGTDHPAEAIDALEHVTKRMSCEFAVRPLLRAHWDQTYARLVELTAHDDERVRRLPSEGTRPLLPWAARVPRLLEEPDAGLALLERLRHDPSETVRRSVANHLNDVSRRHPQLVIETTSRWLDEAETDRRMVAHGLRTLVKAGDPGALGVLGFATDPEVEVERFEVGPAVVEMGDHLVLEADLRSTGAAAQHLVIDFVVHHVNASGATSPKVFKWTTVDLAAGERRRFAKRRLIRQASTRTYRSGTHHVELQVGGRVVATRSFEVRA